MGIVGGGRKLFLFKKVYGCGFCRQHDAKNNLWQPEDIPGVLGMVCELGVISNPRIARVVSKKRQFALHTLIVSDVEAMVHFKRVTSPNKPVSFLPLQGTENISHRLRGPPVPIADADLTRVGLAGAAAMNHWVPGTISELPNVDAPGFLGMSFVSFQLCFCFSRFHFIPPPFFLEQ